MDETEVRMAGLEKALLALVATLDTRSVAAAIAILRGDLAAAEGEDRDATVYALDLLEDGRKRFAGPALGLVITGR